MLHDFPSQHLLPVSYTQYAHRLTAHKDRPGQDYMVFLDGEVLSSIYSYATPSLEVSFVEDPALQCMGLILGMKFLQEFGVNPLDLFATNAYLGNYGPRVQVLPPFTATFPTGNTTQTTGHMATWAPPLPREEGEPIYKYWKYKAFAPLVGVNHQRNLAAQEDMRRDGWAASQTDQDWSTHFQDLTVRHLRA